MGTNYYWKNYGERSDDINIHIGKRSAAGLYCYDCGTTFTREGTELLHTGKSTEYDNCPCCGKTIDENNKSIYNAANVELGFQKDIHGIKLKGVQTASSFTWTLMKHKYNIIKKMKITDKLIVDEYDREFTCKEFVENVLVFCPIEYQTPCEFF